MKFYHAAEVKNVSSIVETGLRSHYEGVYLCEKPEDAMKFLRVRGIKKIAVFEVNIRKNDKSLCESFDHSYIFFKCRAFIYVDNIPPEKITKCMIYEFS